LGPVIGAAIFAVVERLELAGSRRSLALSRMNGFAAFLSFAAQANVCNRSSKV
jgi:hypothetical protein